MQANRPTIALTRGGVSPRETRGLPSRTIRRGWLSGLILALLMPWPCCLRSAGVLDEIPEYELKAAFLYKFAQYVNWPSNAFDNPTSPLTIGVLGQNLFGSFLDDTVAGKTLNGRKFKIQYLKVGDAEGIEKCHMLFINPSEKERVSNILTIAQRKGILTVSQSVREYREFALRGGMINFFLDDQNRLRFEINAEAAEKAGLKISSQLGALGKRIKTEGTQNKSL